MRRFLDIFGTDGVKESVSGAPCDCGWPNALPTECLRHDWQLSECGGCGESFEYRALHRATDDDPEGFIIQSRQCT